jgi:hypothetical protein
MKSIFDEGVRMELAKRIDALTINNKPSWGKMTVAQMLRHCSLCEEYYLGNIIVRRSFAGRIFGKQAIRGILKDENTKLGKNAPTAKQFLVRENIIDLETEKLRWKLLIERYNEFNSEEFNHWFFGKMTREQLGQFIYKHSDHHLRQFGA